MANIDYIKKGAGAFASLLALDAPLDRFSTTIAYTRSRLARPDSLRPGLAVMVNNEIMRLESVGDQFINVKRGCADTIPAPHGVDDVVWIFDVATLGGDRVERSATEVVGVKVSPFTVGGGGIPVGNIPPVEVTFNWRFFRPYPPAALRANAERWTVVPTLDDDTPALHLTWAHRDRVLQADQLIGHDDDSIGPEPGTTYTMRIVHPVTGQVVRTEAGIRGREYLYRRGQALADLGNPNEVLSPTWTFTSAREGFDALQAYSGQVTVEPNESPLYTPFLPFDWRVIETPYAVNVRYDMPVPAGDYALAMAARPADRAADAYQMFANGGTVNTGSLSVGFTPWITLEYRLPELETTLNIRSSSLFDGVALAGVQVGHAALIDDEIVQVERVTPTQIFVRRGCMDTVPAVHLPGARVWFFQASAAFDKTERTDGESLAYQLLPVAYGAPHDLGAQPAYGISMSRRAELPYAPGRIVVNGRPWFEEAQATAGFGVSFSWARRNRVAQGSGILAHDDPDQAPEPGQTVRLHFYYETPPANAGEPPVVHTLRQVDTGLAQQGAANPQAGLSYTYTYAMAQADGMAAGQALGICGTVVILCRISAMRDGLASLQSYVAPIRVPSFPC